MHFVVTMRLPADAANLASTRRAVAGCLDAFGASRETQDDVILALNEACANVVLHAFPSDGPGTMQIETEVDDHAVSVKVEDDGVGFDPSVLDDGAERTSGRGLHMIRQLMTSLEVESPVSGGGTRVTMRKCNGAAG